MLSPEIKFLLLSSRTSLDENSIAGLLDLTTRGLDWEKILSLSLYHGTAPLIYHSIVASVPLKKAVPEKILETLKNYYYANLSKTLKLWEEFCDIHDSFRNLRIELIPLKGIILGNTLYHNPALRSILADIDILIHKSDGTAASTSVKELGYNKGSFNPGGHIGVFRKGQSMVELHYQFFPEGLNKIDTDALWERNKETIVDNRSLRVLSWEDNLLTLALQIRHDWPHVRIYRFCDINEILTQYKDVLDWEYLAQASKKSCIKNTLGFAIYAAGVFFDNGTTKRIAHNLFHANSFRYNMLLSHLENCLIPGKQKLFHRQVSRWHKILFIDNPVGWSLFQIKKRRVS
ncbi:MAG: nucleotidyltransferase family protein [Candidatus Omnitrophota bacterium]